MIEVRTRSLDALGYRVIRFSNRQVITETTVVLDTILAALAATPPAPGERVEDDA